MIKDRSIHNGFVKGGSEKYKMVRLSGFLVFSREQIPGWTKITNPIEMSPLVLVLQKWLDDNLNCVSAMHPYKDRSMLMVYVEKVNFKL